MQVLWAPWRMAYVGRGGTPGECIFCRATTGDARERLLLGASETALVMLNRYPYQNGHLMVAPRRHTADFVALPEAEHAALQQTLRRALATLTEVFAPQGFNVGLNLGACAGAGVVDHLHWHIVPRWAGDTNFMTTVADARILPQHLLDTYDRLHPSFRWLDERR